MSPRLSRCRTAAVGLLVVSAAACFAPAAGAGFGSPDRSFGTDGVVTVAIGDSATAWSVAVQPDGDLVTVGFARTGEQHELAVTRHRADGSLDPDFGTGGVVLTRVGIYPEGQAVALQTDGKIVVAGKSLADRYTPELVLARYRADGSPDTAFGQDGVVTRITGQFAINEVVGLALTPTGKLVVAARVGPNGASNFGVLRFNPDGTVDETFGTNGMVVTEMSTFAAAASVESCGLAYPGGLVLLPDGKVVVVGSLECYRPEGGTWSQVGLVRYNVDGSRDRAFGTDGILLTVLEGYGGVVTRQPDGSLVVGTTSPMGGFALARYLADGTLDTSFGTGGTVRTPFDSYHLYPSGLLIEPDGKVVMNGSMWVGTNSRGFALARYEADGTPDSTFGSNGVTTVLTGHLLTMTDHNTYHHTLVCPERCVSPVVRQADGRLVVADGASNTEQEHPAFRLLRFADAPPPNRPASPPGGEPTTTTTSPQRTNTPAHDPAAGESSAATGPAGSSTQPASPAQPLTPGSAPSTRRPRPSAMPAADPVTGATTPPDSVVPASLMPGDRPSPADPDESAAPVTAERKDGPSGVHAVAIGVGAVLLAGVAMLGARRRRRA